MIASRWSPAAPARHRQGQQPGVTEDRVNSERYDLGLDSAWELDLFGRIRRQLESSDALSEAAEADLQQLQVSLIAELVDATANCAARNCARKIALSNLENQKESRQLTEQLRDAGVGAELDVLRADARLAASRQRAATAGGSRARQAPYRHPPRPTAGRVDSGPFAARPAGDHQDPADQRSRRAAAPPAGHPRRRTAHMAASTADVGVATADLFPRVSLSGFLGFTAGRGSQIGSSAARAWSVSRASVRPPSTSAACVPACAAPRPTPTPRWPATNSRCCWPWKNRRMPSATMASARGAWSRWSAGRKPAAPPRNRRRSATAKAPPISWCCWTPNASNSPPKMPRPRPRSSCTAASWRSTAPSAVAGNQRLNRLSPADGNQPLQPAIAAPGRGAFYSAARGSVRPHVVLGDGVEAGGHCRGLFRRSGCAEWIYRV